jgi:hypothetical protein
LINVLGMLDTLLIPNDTSEPAYGDTRAIRKLELRKSISPDLALDFRFEVCLVVPMKCVAA